MDSPVPKLETLDDRECADRLAALRWPQGFRCEDCGEARHYRLARRPRVFECARCRHQQSVTAGTALHRSRVPLASWFVAAARMVRPDGVSAAELQRALGVTYETAWQLLHKIRATLSGDPGFITGLTEMVHVFLEVRPARDTMPRRPAHLSPAVPLIIGVGQEGAFVEVPASRRPHDLLCDVGSRVSGPVLTSGNWFRHLAQIQPIERSPSAALKMLRALRRMTQGTHRSVSKSWLGRYLREFMYRTNRAPSPQDILQQALGGRWCSFSIRPLHAHAA